MEKKMKEITFENIVNANKLIKTTNIKGKDYAEVNQRVKAFRSVFPQGFIRTEISSIDEGVCIITATVGFYDEGWRPVLLGTGTAYEKESSSFINKTSYIENCVPLNTQILTKDGWKWFYQLQLNDEALSLNMETNKMEYCKILRVNRYKDKPLLKLKTSRFEVVCTPAHKWVAKTQYTNRTKIPTNELATSWKIVQAVKQDVEMGEMGRKLGWLMCDSQMNTCGGLASTCYISQSKHTEDIKSLFGEGRLCKKYKDTWLANYEWVVQAEVVRQILGYFGMADYKDLSKAMLKARIEDVAGCYHSMMLADGEQRGFSSTYPELIDAVQIMCARLGIATTFITQRKMKNSTRPIYTLGIKKTDGAWFSEMEVKNMPPQDVWCPTTENGTWVMEQNGFVTLTSNCETSAVGRALGMAGFGIDVSIASAEEVSNAILNQVPKDLPKIKKGAYMDDDKLRELLELAESIGWDEKRLVMSVRTRFGKNVTELNVDEYTAVVNGLCGVIADGKQNNK